MKHKLNSPIEVEWIDIVSDSSWLKEDKAKIEPAIQCKTIGYFLNSDKEVLRLSHSYQLKDKERDVSVIPWGVIKKIRKLKF